MRVGQYFCRPVGQLILSLDIAAEPGSAGGRPLELTRDSLL